MEKRLEVVLAAVVGLLLMHACGVPNSPPGPKLPDSGRDAGSTVKDSGVDPPGPDGGLALRGACTVLNARRCEYLQRCGLVDSSETSLRDCVAYFSATWCGSPKWPARVEVGTLRYDPLGAQACADAFLSHGCSGWEAEPPECGRFLSPSSYLTQACYGVYDECREGVCRGSSCPRKCQARGLLGESCDEDSDCKQELSLYCRLPSGSTTGIGSCAAYGVLGTPCDMDTPCREDHFCASWGQCQPRRTLGQDCVPGGCVDSAWCAPGADGGVCVARRDAGEACTDDVQCQPQLLCETLSGACGSRLLAGGAACSVRQSCADDNVCRGATASQLGECGPPSAQGGECTTSFDCEPQLACGLADGGTGRACTARFAEGAGCAHSRDCQVLLRCVSGLCTPLPLPGSPCLNGTCLYGTCEPSEDGGFVCGDIGGPGDPCVFDEECGSNRCVFGKCLPACAP